MCTLVHTFDLLRYGMMRQPQEWPKALANTIAFNLSSVLGGTPAHRMRVPACFGTPNWRPAQIVCHYKLANVGTFVPALLLSKTL